MLILHVANNVNPAPSGGGLFSSGLTNNSFGQQSNPNQLQAGQAPFGTFGGGNTGGTAFSFGQPKTAATGAFGQPAAEAENKPFSFGASNTTQPSNNPFGQASNQTTQQTSQSGGLFSNLGGGSNTIGAFGQQNQQGGVGTTGTLGGFSFAANQAQNKPGGLFGNAGNTQPALSFGAGPGAPAAANPFGGSSLFSNTANQQQPQQPQQQNQQQNSLFGGGLGGAGLFGNSQNNSQSQNAYNPLSLTGGSTFGGFNQAQSSTNLQQSQPLQPIQTSIDHNPYGNNPIFANVQANQQSGPKAIDAITASTKKQPALALSYRGTPRSPAKITKLRGFATPTASPALNTNRYSSPATDRGTPLGQIFRAGTTSMNASLSLSNNLADGLALSPQAFVSRPSVKKLVIDNTRSRNESDFLFGKSRTASPGPAVSPSVSKSAQSERPAFNPSAQTSRRAVSPPSRVTSTNGNKSKGNTPLDVADSVTPESTNARLLNVHGHDPSEGQYYSKPSLKELKAMSSNELAEVHGLVVGRKGYGEVSWESGPVDLQSLPSVDDLFGGVVVIEEKQVQVYPENYDVEEPEIGQGLNRPATISIDRCWVKDKATREPIMDADHARVKQHIAKLSKQQGFLSYAVDTGTWSFEVEHFSIYVGYLNSPI